MNQSERYMSLALRLAKKADGMTSPNPLVGAVVVKGGKILGRGYHKKAGLPHAEIEAFLDAERRGYNPRGSTLYVTLEPCCHKEKKTPPCTDAIIKKGISSVVVGCLDLNPKVSGKGVEILRESGINVEVGVLEERCRKINEAFFKYVNTGLPFVILKLASTLDGKIATSTGDSKWIGSETQRRYTHKLRNRVDAIVVGIETVLRDDPQLTVRLNKKTNRQPTPVVLDSRLRIPFESQLLKVHRSPIIATTRSSNGDKAYELEKRGARVLLLEEDERGRVDILGLVKRLGEMEITSILVEGGSEVAASFLMKGLVDKVTFFYAPKIIGNEGIDMIGKLGISRVSEAFTIIETRVRTIGEEFVVEGYIGKAIWRP
jgi:diaminohydroxyphosphoribosylaminopyrimidine deaminase/5-amino-6-(5-phosphoribosylamino)uracil reductase